MPRRSARSRSRGRPDRYEEAAATPKPKKVAKPKAEAEPEEKKMFGEGEAVMARWPGSSLFFKAKVQTSALMLNEGPHSTQSFVITEKAPNRAFSWLKAATTAFTFKTLLRHYVKRALTPRSLNVKLGPRRKGHKGRVGWLAKCLIAARPS